MHNLDEISYVVKNLKKVNNKFALLHCTSVYPTPNSEVRLESISQMKKKYNNVIGLSDHTKDYFHLMEQ